MKNASWLILAIVWLLNQTSVHAEVPVGVIIPLTGDLTLYGKWAKNAAILAADDVKTSVGLKLVFEDDMGKPATAVSAFRKIRAVEEARYFLCLGSSMALALSPLVNKEQVILLDSSATTPKYSSRHDFTFRTGPVATDLAKFAAETLDRWNLNKIAVVTIENDFGEGMRSVFSTAFKGEVVADDRFAVGGASFKSTALIVRQRNPQAIWLVGHFYEGGLVVKDIRDAGITVPILSDIYGVEGTTFITSAGNASNGVRYVAPKFSVERAETKQFFDKYKARFSEEPTVYAAQAYDAVFALSKAISACKDPNDSVCARKALEIVTFEGASGKIQFDENGDVHKELVIKHIDDGTFEPYQAEE